MKTFKALVNTSTHKCETTVSANDALSAKNLLEAQYGKNNVLSVPVEVQGPSEKAPWMKKIG